MEIHNQVQLLAETGHIFNHKIGMNVDLGIIKARSMETIQINIGRKCNMMCAHCHVGADNNRREMMDKVTVDKCLQLIRGITEIKTVDITGGAPEMNDCFRYLVTESKKAGKKVVDRCNLTILEEEGYEYLYEFLADNEVEIIASLPHFDKTNTDLMRGWGVFEKSVTALKKLNRYGYGTKHILNLIYNPSGFAMCESQALLEADFKKNLQESYGIIFNKLYCLNNIPINRFLDELLKQESLLSYMETLVNAFNPDALNNLMCMHQISISYDGSIYDCDFNQMLDFKAKPISTIDDFDYDRIINRQIITANHCWGCTAGAGSSCTGAIVEA